VRILLAEDHDVARVGLKQLLTSHPGWEVCAEAKNGHDAVRLAQKLKPDLVVMDVGMPELNGLEATRKIRKILPRTQVVILTVHFTDQLVRDIVEAGARGYIIKSDAGRELISAVQTVANGRSYFTSNAANALHGPHSMPDARASKRKRLTPREREIAQLLAEGKTSKEVAVALRLSVKTVETHRANLMRKLELHSVSELVRYAIKNQIIES
jgi:DNA-binding NarL/FixJ family response regulator